MLRATVLSEDIVWDLGVCLLAHCLGQDNCCCQEVPVPHYMGLSIGLLECAFSQSKPRMYGDKPLLNE